MADWTCPYCGQRVIYPRLADCPVAYHEGAADCELQRRVVACRRFLAVLLVLAVLALLFWPLALLADESAPNPEPTSPVISPADLARCTRLHWSGLVYQCYFEPTTQYCWFSEIGSETHYRGRWLLAGNVLSLQYQAVQSESGACDVAGGPSYAFRLSRGRGGKVLASSFPGDVFQSLLFE